jgi:uroporphyrinogen decarboxylase
MRITSRERVRLALNHKESDRIPVDFGATAVTGITLPAYKKLCFAIGLEEKNPVILSRAFQLAEVDEEIFDYFDVDFRPVFYNSHRIENRTDSARDCYEDEWGVVRFRSSEGLYFDVVEHPLAEAEIEDLETYPWPNPLASFRFEGVERLARNLYESTNYALVGPGYDGGFFEDAWMMRGYERFLVDLLNNQDFAIALMRKILHIRKLMTGRYLELVGKYLDVIYVADDLAIQTGLLISPQAYRKIVKPLQKEYYQFIKERTEAKLFYHCCGNIEPLLEDLIEIGVDIINPVQVSAEGMDTKVLKEKYGDRICFWGGVDTQHVLPYGKVNDVRREVRKRVRELAFGGGYVLAPVHNIQPDISTENICAIYEEVKYAGEYPIRV